MLGILQTRRSSRNRRGKSSALYLFTFTQRWLGTLWEAPEWSKYFLDSHEHQLLFLSIFFSPRLLSHHLGMARNGSSQVAAWSTWRVLGILHCWYWSPRHRLGFFRLFESWAET